MQKIIQVMWIGSLFMLFLMGCSPSTTEPINSENTAPSTEEGNEEAEIPAEPIETPVEILPANLSETYWDLITLSGVDVSGQNMTLNLGNNNAVSGSDGCNSFQSSYTAENGQFVFDGPFISTMMACGDMTLSDQYTAALSTAGKGYQNQGQLIIESPEGNLVYTPAVFAELTNTKWTLNSLSDGEAVMSMPIDQNIFFTIEGNSVNGSGGCNNFGGAVDVNGDQISFGDVFSTEMFCEGDGVSEREAEFLTALSQVASFSIVRDTLTLFDQTDGIIAVFNQAVESNGVMGRQWTLLNYIVGGDAAVPAPQGTNIYFEILEDGTMAGNSGCNMFNGMATIDGNSMSAGPFATTRMACAENIMEVEMVVLSLLEQTSSFAIEGGRLLLFSADGLWLAEFN